MEEDKKLSMEYVIRSITDSRLKGKTEIYLEPKEPFNPHMGENNVDIELKNKKQGIDIGQIMKQSMQQLPPPIRKMMQGGNPQGRKKDPRGLLLIEDSINFKHRKWHHGDIITVTLSKKQEE